MLLLQEKIYDLMERDSQFANDLGFGVGFNYRTLPKRLQEYIFDIAKRNSNYALGLGSGLEYIFRLC